MQRWQMEVSKTAAMAALLAANAGWWQLETLLAPLAAQVAAGVRPELLALMKVSLCRASGEAALTLPCNLSFRVCTVQHCVCHLVRALTCEPQPKPPN